MGARHRRIVWAVPVVVMQMVGCDLLEIEYPGVILPEDLAGADALSALYAGAIGDFAGAYSGPRSHVVFTGLLSDEFINASTSLEFRSADQRTNKSGLDEMHFYDLHRARGALKSTSQRMSAGSDDTPDPRYPELLSLAGYTHVLLAEAFCSGSPLSSMDAAGRMSPDGPRSTEELLEVALIQFDGALAAASGSGREGDLARIGKARALMGLGRYAEAAMLVRDVSTAFRYQVGHSGDAVWNGVAVQNSGNISVADQEGHNGLPFRSADDPRLQAIRSPADDVGRNGVTPMFRLLSYESHDSPIALALGHEARLIEAEAALAANDPVWLTILSELRAASGLDFSGVAPIEDQGSVDGNVDLLFSERAFWLFANGHRLGDMRRLIRQYGRDPEQIFPVGEHHTGGVYSTGVNFGIPSAELINPNFEGCLDQGA